MLLDILYAARYLTSTKPLTFTTRLQVLPFQNASKLQTKKKTIMIASIPNPSPYPTFALKFGLQKGTVKEMIWRIALINCNTEPECEG